MRNMEIIIQTLDGYMNNTAQIPPNGVLVVMPATHEAQAQQAATLASQRAGMAGTLLVVLDAQRVGLVKVHNQIFRASRNPLYGYVAQDVFAGRQWLSKAAANFDSNSCGLVAFNDGKWHGEMASFGLVNRAWVQSVYGGDLFFPGYERHYADTELSLIARQQGAFAYEANAVAVEVDWGKDQASVHAPDRSLFRVRARSGFAGRVHNEDLLNLFG